MLAWAKATGFTGGSGQTCLVTEDDGKLAMVLFGRGNGSDFGDAMAHAKLARSLPVGKYRLQGDRSNPVQDQLA